MTRPPLSILLITLAACTSGGADKGGDTDGPSLETADSGAPIETDLETDIQGPDVVDPCSELVDRTVLDACDLSVNGAELAEIGSERALRISISDTTNGTPPAQGAFNGAGIGNRAIAGWHNFDLLALSAFDLVGWTASPLGNPERPLEVGLVVDLACDYATIVNLFVSQDDLPTPVDGEDGAQTWSIARVDPVWTAFGGVDDPTAPGTRFIPDPDLPEQPPRVSLQSISSRWPSACLRNTPSAVPELPRSPTAVSAVHLALGRAANRSTKADWKLLEMKVDDKTYGLPE
jgi:hypothetical protein